MVVRGSGAGVGLCALRGKGTCAEAHVSHVCIGAAGRRPQASLGEGPRCPAMNGPLFLRLCEPVCVQVPSATWGKGRRGAEKPKPLGVLILE